MLTMAFEGNPKIMMRGQTTSMNINRKGKPPVVAPKYFGQAQGPAPTPTVASLQP